MDLDRHYAQEWREKAMFVASKLDRAYWSVQDVDSALEAGDPPSVDRGYRWARNALRSVAGDVKAFRSEQPATEHVRESDATGSTLAIRGASVATIALDVTLNALMALASTGDDHEADFLIRASMDAGIAYQAGAAIAHAAPRTHGTAIVDLKQAFETEVEIALRDRVTAAHSKLLEMRRRTGRVSPEKPVSGPDVLSVGRP
jgi:hypothetical protein